MKLNFQKVMQINVYCPGKWIFHQELTHHAALLNYNVELVFNSEGIERLLLSLPPQTIKIPFHHQEKSIEIPEVAITTDHEDLDRPLQPHVLYLEVVSPSNWQVQNVSAY